MKKSISILFLFLVYTAHSQMLTTVVPGSGNRGQTLNVIISGQSTHFGQGTSTTSVWFEQASSTYLYPTTLNIVNNTQLSCQFTIPNSAVLGYYKARVWNSIDGNLQKANAFLVNPNPTPPSIVTVNPSAANQGQILNITISGQNTHFGQGTSTTSVWFSQGSSLVIYPNNVVVNNITTLTSNFTFTNFHIPGYYDVNVYNSVDDQLVKYSGFQLNPNPTPPAIVSVTPNTGYQGQSLNIAISGQYTHFTQATNTGAVRFIQGSSTVFYPLTLTPQNDTHLTIDMPLYYSYPTGMYDVVVTNPVDGDVVKFNGFNLLSGSNPPSIAQVTPDTIVAGTFVQIMVKGHNTHFLGNTVYTVCLSNVNFTLYMGWIEINDSTLQVPLAVPDYLNNGYYDLTISSEIDGMLHYNHAVYLKHLPVGFEDLVKLDGILVYPNPGNGLLQLVNNSGMSIDKITMYNTQGQQVDFALDAINPSQLTLNLQHQSRGVYYLHLQINKKDIVKKIILQ